MNQLNTKSSGSSKRSGARAPDAVRAIGYVRISGDKQADVGVSLQVQESRVRLYAQLHGLDLVDVVVDAGVSGKTLDRPGLAYVLRMLRRRKVGAVVVMKLDRLTRSVADLNVLLDKYFTKAALLSVSEQVDIRSAHGRLVLNMLASVAQWEREAIGERTATAMQHKKSKGERVGAVPYGYALAADGVALVEVPEEQTVASAARALWASGLSLRGVAAELDRRGFTTRSGRTFASEQVRRMTTETA